jgi:protein involved in plasmid replication-relaxation
MSRRQAPMTQERRELLRWTASLGAITAEALSLRDAKSLACARGRLSALCRQGLLRRARVLYGQPALFTLTPAGARAVAAAAATAAGAAGSSGAGPDAGLAGASGCRVSDGNAKHLIACAQAAAALERCYPGQRAIGERELRRAEHAGGRPLASARMEGVHAGPSGLHRPDLVLVAPAAERALPVAVEVELTVKAPRRLRAICRAWARCPRVAGVLYLVAEPVQAPLQRAVADAGATDRIAVVPLAALPGARV